jgi:hypothetical protein
MNINQIWAVYSHLPGGELVAIHFEDLILKRSGHGGNDQEIMITAKEQYEAFKRSPQVALYINKKLNTVFH